MLAIFALLSASKGLIVPPLNSIPGFPTYDGDVMVPFSNDFSWLSGPSASTRTVIQSDEAVFRGLLRALD